MKQKLIKNDVNNQTMEQFKNNKEFRASYKVIMRLPDTVMSHNEKSILSIVIDYQEDGLQCFISNPGIQKELGLSEGQVKRSISKLTHGGYIKSVVFRNTAKQIIKRLLTYTPLIWSVVTTNEMRLMMEKNDISGVSEATIKVKGQIQPQGRAVNDLDTTTLYNNITILASEIRDHLNSRLNVTWQLSSADVNIVNDLVDTFGEITIDEFISRLDMLSMPTSLSFRRIVNTVIYTATSIVV